MSSDEASVKRRVRKSSGQRRIVKVGFMKKKLIILVLIFGLLCSYMTTVSFAENEDATNAPQISTTFVEKPNIIYTDLEYELSNYKDYTEETSFIVYGNANRTSHAVGITASLSWSALVLSHESNLPVGKDWVRAKEKDKEESECVELTIGVKVGKIVFWT